MAVESVATDSHGAPKRFDPPSRDNFEADPFERITIRLKGLEAVRILACDELNEDTLHERVWQDLWYFVGKTLDDIAQDAELLRRERLSARTE